MSRPLRILYPGAMYHVINRGADKRPIFFHATYCDLFLDLLKKVSSRFQIDIIGYCLMQNHYHLIVRTRKANLSQAMRQLNGVYTQKINRILQKDGALFKGRYKAILIQDNQYLLQVSRYVHLNPLNTALKENPFEYAWSSLRAYVQPKKEDKEWINTEIILSEIGGKNKTDRYREYINQGIDEETKDFYNKGKTSILGSKEFNKKIKAHSLKLDTEINKDINNQIPIEFIITKAAEYFNVEEDDLTKNQQGIRKKNIPRIILIYLCREWAGYSLKQIAVKFNMGHYSSITKLLSRSNDILENKKIQKDLETFLSQLVTCQGLTPSFNK